MKALSLALAFVCLSTSLVAQTTPPAGQAAPQAGQTEQPTYKNSIIGVQFNYPKTWIVSTNKKGESRFIIPVPNSSQKAVLELYPVNFRSEKDVWQLSQAGIAKSQKRTVERQWEEEILGVPLLLTKVTAQDKGGPEVTLNGLMYTLSTAKLGYRLTATPDDFDRASFEWQQAMQSIRTEDGQMPKPEDPSVELAPRTKDDLAHPTNRNVISSTKAGPAVKSPVAQVGEAGGKKVEVHVPEGWQMTPIESYKSQLSNPGLSGKIDITLASSLDSDTPGIALLKASAASLPEFTTVVRRDENLPKLNRAGSTYAMVWRNGKGANGELNTCEAFVQNGDSYVVLSFKSADAAHAASDRKLLEELVDRMSVEAQP